MCFVLSFAIQTHCKFLFQIFGKNIFAIINSIKMREEGKLKNPVVNATPITHMKPSGSGPNYNRYDQERFAKDKNSKWEVGFVIWFHLRR